MRAYTSAAIDGLEHSESITRIHGIKLLIRAEYTDLGKIQYLLASRDVIQLDPVYTDKVELMALVPVEQMKGLKADLMEGTNGQVVLDETVQCWFAQTEDGIRIFSMKLPMYCRSYFFPGSEGLDVLMLFTPDEGKAPLLYAIDDLVNAAAKEELNGAAGYRDLGVVLGKNQ